MSIINALVDHGHSHESKLFADVIASHNEIVASLESHNRELLAVIAAKDEAIHQMLNVAFKLPPTTQQEHDVRSREVHDATKGLERAFSIKPGDIALIEVGYASEPSIQNLINGNDVIVGKKNDIRTEAVYALQKKEGK